MLLRVVQNILPPEKNICHYAPQDLGALHSPNTLYIRVRHGTKPYKSKMKKSMYNNQQRYRCGKREAKPLQDTGQSVGTEEGAWGFPPFASVTNYP